MTSNAARGAEVKALKITVLSTMLAGERTLGEWGYSALVELDGRKILFDAGMRPETVLANAEALGVDLSDVEDVVLSHAHPDHVGGVVPGRKAFMAKNPKAFSRIHVAEGFFLIHERRGAPRNAHASSIAFRKDHGSKLHVTDVLSEPERGP